MAINLSDNLNIAAPKPIDPRIVQPDRISLDSITFLYPGLQVMVLDTYLTYVWNGSTWSLFAGGSGGTGSGAQGFQGFQGYQGPTGDQGYQGPTGDQGFQGPTGVGSQGYQGIQGPTGFQGFQGPQGFQGTYGDQGYQGPTGFQGYQGDLGAQGSVVSLVQTIVQWNYGGLLPIADEPQFFRSEKITFADNSEFQFSKFDSNNIDYSNWFDQLDTFNSIGNPVFFQIYN